MVIALLCMYVRERKSVWILFVMALAESLD
jgi:hypothetical protein